MAASLSRSCALRRHRRMRGVARGLPHPARASIIRELHSSIAVRGCYPHLHIATLRPCAFPILISGQIPLQIFNRDRAHGREFPWLRNTGNIRVTVRPRAALALRELDRRHMKPATEARSSPVCVGVLIAMALTAGPVQAQDTFSVNGPTFVTNGGALAIVDGDDTLTVAAPAGSITVGGVGENGIETIGDNNTVIIENGTPVPALNVNGAGGDGINMTGDNSQVIADGRIEISGGPDGINRGFGIVVEGDNANIQVLGSQPLNSIVVGGVDAVGIAVFGDDGRVISNAFIDMISDGNVGIWGEGDRITLTNLRSIGISGNATGMLLTSEDGLAVNAGSINNSGAGGLDNVIAIDASGDRVRVINLVGISLLGDDSLGIRMSANDGSILNEGDIEMSGAGVSRGINLSGSRNTIDHTGTITMSDPTGSAAFGIFVLGSDNVVSVTGNGEISTTGQDGRGISVTGNGNRVVFDGWLIQTTGENSSGISGRTGSGIIIQTGSTNGAEIVTQGANAYGIAIQFNADDATVLNGRTFSPPGLMPMAFLSRMTVKVPSSRIPETSRPLPGAMPRAYGPRAPTRLSATRDQSPPPRYNRTAFTSSEHPGRRPPTAGSFR